MTTIIIGRGALGSAIVRALRDRGVPCRALPGRTESPRDRATLQQASVVVLAVPDPRIYEVCERIAPSLPKRAVVLHAAGARTAADLDSARLRGNPVGVLHPMVSFPSSHARVCFEGATLVGSGDARALRAGRALARHLGATFVAADVHGAAYHAAAALVANGSVALAWNGVSILESLGMSPKEAQGALGGLLASVAHNIARVGLPEALTGPIARGDASTVARHREALLSCPPAAAAAYDVVAPVILACARARGLDEPLATAIESAIATTLPRLGPRMNPKTRARTAAPRPIRPR